jgi:hypothetical protein
MALGYQVDSTDDLPRSEIPTGIPFWSESFAYWAYPWENDFDFMVHYQRQVADPGIWKGMLCFLIDNEEALVIKKFGRQADPMGPGALGMHAICREPGKKWLFQFDGAAQRVKQADMWNHELRDGIVEPLFAEIEFDALSPLWSLDPTNLKTAGSNAMMSHHYEQAYRTKGLLRFGGRERRFEGAGYRDHSYGPRNYKRMGPSQIVFGMFPSNRAFWFITGRTPEGEYAHCEGAVSIDGELYPIKLDDPEFHGVLITGEKKVVDYVLKSEIGEHNVRITYTGRGMPFTLTPPAEEVLGAVGGFDKVQQAYWEAHISAEWDGEKGVGSAQGTIWR